MGHSGAKGAGLALESPWRAFEAFPGLGSVPALSHPLFCPSILLQKDSVAFSVAQALGSQVTLIPAPGPAQVPTLSPRGPGMPRKLSCG